MVKIVAQWFKLTFYSNFVSVYTSFAVVLRITCLRLRAKSQGMPLSYGIIIKTLYSDFKKLLESRLRVLNDVDVKYSTDYLKHVEDSLAKEREPGKYFRLFRLAVLSSDEKIVRDSERSSSDG